MMPFFSHYTLMFVIFIGTVMMPPINRGYAQSGAIDAMSEKGLVSELEIVMESYEYSPSVVTVKVGIPFTLVLKNESFLVPHNFLLDDPQGNRVLERDVSSGESERVDLTLTQPGTYPFYCDKQLLFFPSHEEQGMKGRLVVQE